MRHTEYYYIQLNRRAFNESANAVSVAKRPVGGFPKPFKLGIKTRIRSFILNLDYIVTVIQIFYLSLAK